MTQHPQRKKTQPGDLFPYKQALLAGNLRGVEHFPAQYGRGEEKRGNDAPPPGAFALGFAVRVRVRVIRLLLGLGLGLLLFNALFVWISLSSFFILHSSYGVHVRCSGRLRGSFV